MQDSQGVNTRGSAVDLTDVATIVIIDDVTIRILALTSPPVPSQFVRRLQSPFFLEKMRVSTSLLIVSIFAVFAVANGMWGKVTAGRYWGAQPPQQQPWQTPRPAWGPPAPAPAPAWGPPAPAPAPAWGPPAPAPAPAWGRPAPAPASPWGRPAPAPASPFGRPAPAPAAPAGPTSSRATISGTLKAVVAKYKIDPRVNAKNFKVKSDQPPTAPAIVDALGADSGECSKSEIGQILGNAPTMLNAMKQSIGNPAGGNGALMLKYLYDNALRQCPILMKSFFTTYGLYTKRFMIVLPKMKKLAQLGKAKAKKECATLPKSTYKDPEYQTMLKLVQNKMKKAGNNRPACVLPIMTSMSYICQYKKLYDAVRKTYKC